MDLDNLIKPKCMLGHIPGSPQERVNFIFHKDFFITIRGYFFFLPFFFKGFNPDESRQVNL